MKTFKLILILLSIVINIAFYFAFFAILADESVNETTNLLILIAAMVMTIMINQTLKEN